jgi:hypothetical protein
MFNEKKNYYLSNIILTCIHTQISKTKISLTLRRIKYEIKI